MYTILDMRYLHFGTSYTLITILVLSISKITILALWAFTVNNIIPLKTKTNLNINSAWFDEPIHVFTLTITTQEVRECFLQYYNFQFWYIEFTILVPKSNPSIYFGTKFTILVSEFRIMVLSWNHCLSTHHITDVNGKVPEEFSVESAIIVN